MKMKTHGNGKTWKRQETGMKKMQMEKKWKEMRRGKKMERNVKEMFKKCKWK